MLIVDVVLLTLAAHPGTAIYSKCELLEYNQTPERQCTPDPVLARHMLKPAVADMPDEAQAGRQRTRATAATRVPAGLLAITDIAPLQQA